MENRHSEITPMRPILMRCTKGQLRRSLFYRFYRPRIHLSKWEYLYGGSTINYSQNARIWLSPADFMHAEIAFTGEYEPALSKIISSLGAKGGTLVDVGANAGYFSLIWAGQNPKNRVFSFEASPKNIALLRHNVTRNCLQYQINVQAIALADKSGTMSFELGPDGVTGWGGLALASGSNTVRVQVRRLDEIIPSDAQIDFLKVDVEGADAWVLMGAEELLKSKRIRFIYYEENPGRQEQLGIKAGEARAFLEAVGYNVRSADDAEQSKHRISNWIAVPR